MQEISAVKFVKIFEMEANLRWALLIRGVRDGRNLLEGFDVGFHPGQDLTARVCSDISSILSKAGAALIETQNQVILGIGLGFKKDVWMLKMRHSSTLQQVVGFLISFFIYPQ